MYLDRYTLILSCLLYMTQYIICMYYPAQVSVLDEAARIHPNTWWWIKADGADLVSGLGESVAGVWSGDVDLANDALIKTRESHQKRIDFIGEIGKNRQDLLEIADDLSVTEQAIVLDTDFVSTSKFFLL